MKFIHTLFLSILAVFAPIKAIVHVTILLIIIDLLSGVWAAKKRGETVTSAGLRRTVTKLFVYLSAIICGYLVEVYMISDILPLSKLISGVIALVEMKSILENLNSINGSDIFKSILSYLDSKNHEPKE